jgi:hypothetical protein
MTDWREKYPIGSKWRLDDGRKAVILSHDQGCTAKLRIETDEGWCAESEIIEPWVGDEVRESLLANNNKTSPTFERLNKKTELRPGSWVMYANEKFWLVGFYPNGDAILSNHDSKVVCERVGSEYLTPYREPRVVEREVWLVVYPSDQIIDCETEEKALSLKSKYKPIHLKLKFEEK